MSDTDNKKTKIIHSDLENSFVDLETQIRWEEHNQGKGLAAAVLGEDEKTELFVSSLGNKIQESYIPTTKKLALDLSNMIDTEFTPIKKEADISLESSYYQVSKSELVAEEENGKPRHTMIIQKARTSVEKVTTPITQAITNILSPITKPTEQFIKQVPAQASKAAYVAKFGLSLLSAGVAVYAALGIPALTLTTLAAVYAIGRVNDKENAYTTLGGFATIRMALKAATFGLPTFIGIPVAVGIGTTGIIGYIYKEELKQFGFEQAKNILGRNIVTNFLVDKVASKVINVTEDLTHGGTFYTANKIGKLISYAIEESFGFLFSIPAAKLKETYLKVFAKATGRDLILEDIERGMVKIDNIPTKSRMVSFKDCVSLENAKLLEEKIASPNNKMVEKLSQSRERELSSSVALTA